MSVWDFIGKDTNEYTHGLHLYPAKLHPYIARRLINHYGKKGQYLLDPFCGSGTTLVEARLAGLNAVGYDVNPTARFMSQAKSRNYDIPSLRSFCKRLDSALDSMELLHWGTAVKGSGFSRNQIKTWYPNKTIREIASSLELIDIIDAEFGRNNKNRLFARVALSDCLRDVSIQRMNEWKNYRIEGWRITNMDDLYQDLTPLFKKKLYSNFVDVKTYIDKLKYNSIYGSTKAILDKVNCVNTAKFTLIPDEGVELVVTSPPYGDSPTTVAYEQFSWQTNIWLGLDTRPSGQLARDMMGGEIAKKVEKLDCRVIDSAISKMEDKFAKRNYSFYRDYLKSVENIAAHVKRGGHVCYIVGNRTSGGQNMRLDLFTRWAFEQNGFKRVGEIRKRKIPNTRMPGIIAVTGNKFKKYKVATMNNEFIIVCKKISGR
jgi:site-specific DNA-methyltransferase (cytosine-N4-specific)